MKPFRYVFVRIALPSCAGTRQVNFGYFCVNSIPALVKVKSVKSKNRFINKKMLDP